MGKVNMKAIFIALIVGVAIMLSPFTVKATGVNPVLEVNSSAGLDVIASEVNKLSQEYGRFDFIKIGVVSQTNKPKVELNMSSYRSNALTSEERKEIMETALKAVNDSDNLSGQSKTRLYNFIANQDVATSSLVRQLSNDVNADFANAYSWFKPFTGGLSTFLGIMAMLIFTLLGIMFIVDISYLTIPMVQLVLNKQNGDKAKLVSAEAWLAIQEAEKDGSGKSYLSIYLKKKTWQVCVVSICLLYLVGGKIYYLIGWIIDVFQGFVV